MKPIFLFLICILILPSVNAIFIEPEVLFNADNTNYNMNASQSYSNVTLDRITFGVDNCYINLTHDRTLNVTVQQTLPYLIRYTFNNNIPDTMNITFASSCPYPTDTYVQNVRIYTNAFEIDTEQSDLVFINPANVAPPSVIAGGGGVASNPTPITLRDYFYYSNIDSNNKYQINMTIINSGGLNNGDLSVNNPYNDITIYFTGNLIYKNIQIPANQNLTIPIFIKTSYVNSSKIYNSSVKLNVNGQDYIYYIQLFGKDIKIEMNNTILDSTPRMTILEKNTLTLTSKANEFLYDNKPGVSIFTIIFIVIITFYGLKAIDKKKQKD